MKNDGVTFGRLAKGFGRLFIGSELQDPVKKKEEDYINRQQLVAVENDEAADLVDMSYYYSNGNMSSQSLITQAQLINEYRTMALHAEVDTAIDDIITEAVVIDADDGCPVKIQFKDDAEGISDAIANKIEDEFQIILHLLKFDYRAYEIFRQWYVDGRIHYQKIIDPKDPRKGILKLVNLDPRALKKVKEVLTNTDEATRVQTIVGTRDYYVYDPNYVQSGMTADTGSMNSSINRMSSQVLEIADEMIATSNSGIVAGVTNNVVLSHLEKARKPLNNLRMLEDACVIYRITRAPERRVFYIDIGSLQKKSAEEYMTSLINKYKTKLVYDATSGKVQGNAHQISMMEDYWLPRREGTKGTEIDTLDGGQNLGKIDDILYFQKKLFKALNVPQSRLENEATISIGNRMAEITRDEWKFNKFVQRLRRKFNTLFIDLLHTQLILKNICTEEDWENNIRDNLIFFYGADSIIKEQQDQSLFENRLAMLEAASEFVGTYLSKKTVMKHILRMNESEIKAEQDQIKKEIKAKEYPDPMETFQLENNIHPLQMQNDGAD